MIHSFVNNKDFIAGITEIILGNMGNENFGVKELAQKSGISKAVLNKRLQVVNKKHVNQFIREIRLHKAMELIHDEKLTASEAAFKVGFSSPTYFNKCFHEFFGYPPGKLKKENTDYNNSINQNQQELAIEQRKIKNKWFSNKYMLLIVLILVTALFLVYPKISRKNLTDNLISGDGRISLVVIPFQNMTNDSV